MEKQNLLDDPSQANIKNLTLRVWELFSPAAPINTADLFAGRTEQINRFRSAIYERGRHVVLYGERGVGKTSLVNIVLPLMKEENSNHIHIRKQASPEDNYTTLWKKIFRYFRYTTHEEIGYGKEGSKIATIADHYREAISSDEVLRELEDICKVAESKLTIIFDEFDKMNCLASKKLMSHTLKLISDSNLDVTIVIVGVASDINTLVEEHESVKRNLEEIKMPRMSTEELKEILYERLPKLNLTISEEAEKKIITLSRGLPEYVHALGRGATLNALCTPDRTSIEEEDVDIAIKIFIQQSSQSANNSFKKATLSNKKNTLYSDVLIACALAETDNDGKFTPSAVIEPLSTILKRKVKIANFQPHLVAFCSKERGNILERLGIARAFKYRFREPKMQQYVIMKGMMLGKVDKQTVDMLATSNHQKPFFGAML